MRVLHVLHSLASEGSPRLALSLLEEARADGESGAVLPLVSDPDDLRSDFESIGVRVFPSSGWTGRDYVSMVFRMRRFLRSNTFDGIVCYALGPHVPIALVARSMRIPCIVHIGNAPPNQRADRLKLKVLLRVGRRFVRAHVACSEYVRGRVIAEYSMPAPDVVVVLNGIDLERYVEVRSQRTGSPDVLLFGMVGSFEGHKDQGTLIRALAALTDRGVAARLELVGRGSYETFLLSLAEELGVDGLITWSGTLSDVRVALSRFDVFTYAVGAQEGLGIALIEALAAGRPCVGSDVGACREVLEGGELGRLVAGRDPDAWADAILDARSAAAAPLERLARFDIASTRRSYEGFFENSGAG